MSINPFIKWLGLSIIFIILGLTTLSLLTGHNSRATHAANLLSFNDKASSDTPVETLKTLTAKISEVELQNKKLIADNQALVEKDQTTLAQFKNDMMSQVTEQLSLSKNDHAVLSVDNAPQEGAHKEGSSSVLTWIPDLEGSDNSDHAGDLTMNATSQPGIHLADYLKNSDVQPQITTQQEPTSMTPFYTLPVNATLTGAIAMQPLIGRIPINGRVPDPYSFKVIIGYKNLAANGVAIPEEVQGMIASGIAEGDLLGRCVRGDIRAMTFVFTDGRISTTEAKEGQVLGTIAAANGNPCIEGTFYTDAPVFLGVTAGLAGLQGYSNALSQSQMQSAVTPEGGSIAALIGSSNQYAAGQGISAAAQATQKWWDQRVESSFDYIFVPNIDIKTGKKLELNINITQEIRIDNDKSKRKVFYAHPNKNDNVSLD